MRDDGATGWLFAPTWQVEAASLRKTLDALRAGLEKPQSGPAASGEMLVHDRGAIAASLRDILRRLDGIDLDATRALSGVVREFRSETQATSLRVLFEELQRALRAHVGAVLGPAKVAVVARLLSSPTPDLLRILGREDHENSHSDLIAWLLTPHKAPIIALHALRQLTSRLFERDPSGAKVSTGMRWGARLADAVADDSVSVRRELVIARELAGADDRSRVDIVVSGPGFVLSIENKIWSKEHSDQTKTYWAWMEGATSLRGGLLLSPSGEAATSADFAAVSYLEFVAALVDGPSRAAISESEEIVLASYLKTLARNIIPVEMRAVLELAKHGGNP